MDCPLKVAGDLASGSPGGGPPDSWSCSGSNCEWWDHHNETCCIWSISRFLDLGLTDLAQRSRKDRD